MRFFTVSALARYTHTLIFLFILVVYASAAPCIGPLYRPYRAGDFKHSQISFGDQPRGYLKINGADARRHAGSVGGHVLPGPDYPTQYSISFGSAFQSEGVRYLGSIRTPTWLPTYENWLAQAKVLLSLTIQQLRLHISNALDALQETRYGSEDSIGPGREEPKIEQIMNDILL